MIRARAMGQDVEISVRLGRKDAALKTAALRLNLDGNTRRFWEAKPAAPGGEASVVSAKRKVRPAPVRVVEGSGNVFADLGVVHPDRELIKAESALQIYRIIRQRGLSQKQVGKVLGISQPQVSVLARNRGASFSVGRLLEFLGAL